MVLFFLKKDSKGSDIYYAINLYILSVNEWFRNAIINQLNDQVVIPKSIEILISC